MKIIIVTLLLLIPAGMLRAQDSLFTVYHPEANAIKEMNDAVAKAEASGKHVLIQIGGNWCKWCRIYYNWSNSNHLIDSLTKADYVVVHANYSKENRNPMLMKILDYPQRFGFPVFVIVDGNGKRLHTQNTGYLEDGEGYSEKKVSEFLEQWNAKSLKEESYK